ncbi:MAG: hypothetical protein H7Z76_00140, partial [Methylotenera sp.]|nr:hypothetical protein [Flavobacterium sp.]
MFTYKTDAQLEAMTAAERDTYATEKRAHEAKIAKEATDLAVSEAIKSAKEEIAKDFEAKLKTATDAVAKAEKSNTDLEAIVVKQGEKLAEMKAMPSGDGNGMAVATNVKSQLEALHKSTNAGTVSEKVTIKVADTADTAIAVNAHNGIAGAIGAI